MNRICKTLMAALLIASCQVGLASSYALRVTDYALPGQLSRLEVLGWCNSVNAYVPWQDCYGGLSFSVDSVVASDKSLQVKLGVYALSGIGRGFDRYVTLRESGNNPAAVDDVLRVQFEVLGPSQLGPDLSLAEMTISLISGSLVTSYLAGLPADSIDFGSYVNHVDEVLAFAGPSAFVTNQSDSTGPRFDGFVIDSFFVSATALSEPSTLAAIGLASLALLGSRRFRKLVVA